MLRFRLQVRKMLRGRRMRLFFGAFPLLIASVCAGSCFFAAGLSFLYGGSVFADGALYAFFLRRGIPQALPAVFLLAACLDLLIAAAFGFTYLGAVYHILDKNLPDPLSGLSFRAGARFLYCEAQIVLRRFGFSLVSRLPAAITLLSLQWVLQAYGLSPWVTNAGLLIVLCQLLFAQAVGFVMGGRYLLAPFLLYQNPMLGVREALASSILLTKGRLLAVARVRRATFWRRCACFLLLPLPFVLPVLMCTDALLAARLYAEDLHKRKVPAVVFYIDRRSVFERRAAY
ncbi:MAG: hypothetical protein IJK02_06045 [Clostridia bacterium]|nr:hypothetical protein [Clostridia bacterium]